MREANHEVAELARNMNSLPHNRMAYRLLKEAIERRKALSKALYGEAQP